MKHKVSELEGALLDAAVAKAEGYELDEYGDNLTIRENGGAPSAWHPSTDWMQGGPIIKRELLTISPQAFDVGPATCAGWVAVSDVPYGLEDAARMRDARKWFGKTPLIAAMRAYVARKFGEEVELP